MTMRLRSNHHTFSMDLLPRALIVEDSGLDYLVPLRCAPEPDPESFVDDFYITPGVDDSDRI